MCRERRRAEVVDTEVPYYYSVRRRAPPKETTTPHGDDDHVTSASTGGYYEEAIAPDENMGLRGATHTGNVGDHEYQQGTAGPPSDIASFLTSASPLPTQVSDEPSNRAESEREESVASGNDERAGESSEVAEEKEEEEEEEVTDVAGIASGRLRRYHPAFVLQQRRYESMELLLRIIVVTLARHEQGDQDGALTLTFTLTLILTFTLTLTSTFIITSDSMNPPTG